NPQAGHTGAALVIVHGPHHYLSPDWYADKAEAARVPTWNYAAAHLTGQLQPLHAEQDLASIVARLGERFEPQVGGTWRYDHADPRERAQLRGIIGFRFVPTRIELKFKLNQNHPAANVSGAIAGLRRQPGERGAEVAALMESRLAARGEDRAAHPPPPSEHAHMPHTLAGLIHRNKVWSERICAENPEFFAQLSQQQAPEYLWIGC